MKVFISSTHSYIGSFLMFKALETGHIVHALVRVGFMGQQNPTRGPSH